MLGLLSYALKRVIIELCQEKSSNHEKHGWNFYSKAVFLQPLASVLFMTATLYRWRIPRRLPFQTGEAGLLQSGASFPRLRYLK